MQTALKDRGHIYKSHYEGWYCEAEEAFLPDSQVIDKTEGAQTKKVSAESGHQVEWNSEENYMFKLTSQIENVLYWVKSGKLKLIITVYTNNVL